MINEENNSQSSNPTPQPVVQPIGSPAVTVDNAPSNSVGTRVIQPRPGIKQELEAQRQQEAARHPASSPVASPTHKAASAYPEAVKSIDGPNLSGSQQFALAATKKYAQENDRPVSLRVKSLLVVGIITLLSGIYYFVVSFTLFEAGGLGILITVLSLIQCGMSLFLLLGKDHHTVALILKVYLVLQLVSLFSSIANPVGFAINAAVVIFLFYVYGRVKSLSY